MKTQFTNLIVLYLFCGSQLSAQNTVLSSDPYKTYSQANQETQIVQLNDVAAEILSANYGPPALANTWEKFTIPLTAETFNVESNAFLTSMQNVSLIRIRTEMHTGADKCGLDSVVLGDRFKSTFDSNTESWSAMGDGTMSWVATGGKDAGYLTIADWANGDWHWAGAPETWSGDLSDQIGKNLIFYYQTNYPSYNAVIEIHTSVASRIVLSSQKQTLHRAESTSLEISLIPAPVSNVTVQLSSSNSSLLTVPSSVVVKAGESTATVTITAAENITAAKEVVITASASGFSTTRTTITVDEQLLIPEVLSVPYGPPAVANTWIKYSIPITAETFNVSEEVFAAAMKMISLVRIRTEMHTGDDKCGLDSVALGDQFISTFDTSTENWSAMGDGTMSWQAMDGVNDGFLTIADWATGDLHWAAAPAFWAGDLSAQIGKLFTFYYRTNQPSYSAVVEFQTSTANRIVLSADKLSLHKGESATLHISMIPAPAENTVVTISPSKPTLLDIPANATVLAGESSTTVNMQVTQSILSDQEVVLSAEAPGYPGTNITFDLKVETTAKEIQAAKMVEIYPNPSEGQFTLVVNDALSGKTKVEVFDAVGRMVYSSNLLENNKLIDLSKHAKGMYQLRVSNENKVYTEKLYLR